MKKPISPLLTVVPPEASRHINRQALINGFNTHKNRPDIRKTHFIDGRHENIYLTSEDIPELVPLLHLAQRHALAYLKNRSIERTGYWFNAMPPGSRTSKHDHHDGDELLSGVFYVEVPKHSGDLVLYRGEQTQTHSPAAGELLLFHPAVPHEVTENLSQQCRLSIGINFLRCGFDQATR